MRLRYLACINLSEVPKHMLPLNEVSIRLLLDTAGWTVTYQEVRQYGHEYWVTLERNIPVPRSLHACCVVRGKDFEVPNDNAATAEAPAAPGVSR